MKMKIKTFLLASCALLGATTCLTSCGEEEVRTENEIRICVYDGGYGTTWIDEIAKQYETKTGVKVVAEVDQSILDRLESQLDIGSDYDIYMSHDINWQNFAARGLLANLDDLYDREIEGTGKTFRERLVKGAADMSITAGADKTEHYYKVCYTQGAGGLVYNVKMFEENNWAIPTTYDELKALCKTIVDAKIPAGDRGTVKPFAWSGKDRQYYWDYIVFEWWAQLAGEEKLDQWKSFRGADGKVSTGYEVYDPNGLYKEFIQAYEMWYNLVSDNTYSTTNAFGETLISAQAKFAAGEAAMIPYAQWAKKEIEKSIASDLPFDIAMMKTPKAVAGAQDYNYMVGFGDSMIIPENTPYKDLAKDFLAYMASDEACLTFVKESEGAFLAFDYSDIDLSSIEKDNLYIKSIHEKLSTNNFHLASKEEITIWNTNVFMPWINNKYYYATACTEPSKNTPEIVGNEIFKAAQSGWKVWMTTAGVKD